MALALSTGIPYDVVAQWDDQIKATYWVLLEDQADQMKGGGGG